jgi:uncharacterized protein YfcZ (UPF0381/DUF406 family)
MAKLMPWECFKFRYLPKATKIFQGFANRTSRTNNIHKNKHKVQKSLQTNKNELNNINSHPNNIQYKTIQKNKNKSSLDLAATKLF